MASHYDRVTGQYATRPSPIAGPSRGDSLYDRDRRIPYHTRREPEYIDDDRLLMRRDDRLHYPPQPQDYVGPPHESRADFGSTSSWSRQPPVYTHSSPPPIPNQHSRYYQDARPAPITQWEERASWDNAPNDRNFEPSPAWRHTRRGPVPPPPAPQVPTWPNPTPLSPREADYRRREPLHVPIEPPHTRDFGHHYPPPPDYHLQYDNRRAQYYDDPPAPDHRLISNDLHRQSHIERPSPSNWENPYRPEMIPAPRANRSSAGRGYKRPRQESPGQSSRYPDNDSLAWTRDRGFDSSRHSRQGSLQSSPMSGTGYRERSTTGSSQFGARNVFPAPSPPPPAKIHHHPWEGPGNEHDFSADELPKDATPAPKHTFSDMSYLHGAFRANETRENQNREIFDYEIPGLSSNRNNEPLSTQRTLQPALRHAWDPSTNQIVPIMGDSSRSPGQIERRSNAPDARQNTVGIASQGPYGQTSQFTQDSSIRRTGEAHSARRDIGAASPSGSVQGSGSNRQGVMSVHDLVSPSPVFPSPINPQTSSSVQRIPTPMVLEDDGVQVDSTTTRESGTRHFITSDLSQSDRIGDWVSGQDTGTNLHVSHDEGVPELERHRSPSDELSILEISQIATPEIYTPEPEGDRTIAAVEIQTAEATIASPRASIILLPGEKISEDGTMRILAPRPKADEKDITEMLRRAIIARRRDDALTRDQRVNPILMDNLAKSDGPEQKIPSVTVSLVQGIAEHFLTQMEEERQMDVRAILATKFAEERERLAEKQQRLRDEYLTLHRRWVADCLNLDSLFKANEMQEAQSQAGRTTRRSATTLGDAVRSDLEMEQIIATLGNEDLTDPNHLAVRNVATIPDMISVVKGKLDYLFDDTNNEVDDPAAYYDPRSGFCDWTPEEEAIFYEKYAEYPKQFGIIAQFLPHKTSHQCVLYYYIHKKRLVDFRNAVNTGNGKRRKGVRKSGKQKGNALLADVAQADSRRPAGRGRRKRGGFGNGRGRGGGPPPSTEESVDPDARAKRRRVGNTPRPNDLEDAASVDTDNTREASVLPPPKKRRGRKPKVVIAAENPDGSPAPGEARTSGTAEGGETTSRRKPGSTATTWSESDREIFMRSLARFGKDFKRIALELPSKTHAQVQNYYKNHNKELGLEKIALAAATRQCTPDQDRFVTVTREEASQSRTPMEELSSDHAVDRQVADATVGANAATPEQNGNSAQSVPRSGPGSRGMTNKSVIRVLNPDNFQSAAENRPQGVLMTPSGQSSYTLSVAQQPAHPHTSSSMTSTMNFHGAQGGSTASPPRSIARETGQQVHDRPKSQPSGGGLPYSFHTHTPPIPTPLSRIAPMHFIPPSMNAVSPPPRPGSPPHGTVDYRNGVPVHLLPTTHPGFWPPSQSLGSPQPPSADVSRKPAA